MRMPVRGEAVTGSAGGARRRDGRSRHARYRICRCRCTAKPSAARPMLRPGEPRRCAMPTQPARASEASALPRGRCAPMETDRAAAGATTRPLGCYGSGGTAHDRDAEGAGLVDEVPGDAAAGEGDDALGQEVEQLVVAAEGCGASVAVPVGLADDLVDAVTLCLAGCDLLDAGAAAMHEDEVCILGAGLVQLGDRRPGRQCPCRWRWRPACPAAGGAGSCGPCGRGGSRGRRWLRKSDVRSGWRAGAAKCLR